MALSLEQPKPIWQAISKPKVFSICLVMRDSARRSRFVAWFNERPCRGDREKLISLTGYSKGRISQLFDEAQPFGERAAANLAEKVGLPAEYFEGYGQTSTDLRLSVAEPAPPPPDFKDRHVVSDSEWETLNAVKLMLSEQEIADLRERAKRFQEKALQHLQDLTKSTASDVGKHKR